MNNIDYGTFVVEKKITSSDITTSNVNIAEFVGNGVIIEDVIARTDSTGLAWGTNFTLSADGIVFFAEAVANLGADTIMDLTNASVTGIKASLGTGTKYVSVANTVGAGTGAGVITIQLVCRKLDLTSIWNAI